MVHVIAILVRSHSVWFHAKDLCFFLSELAELDEHLVLQLELGDEHVVGNFLTSLAINWEVEKLRFANDLVMVVFFCYEALLILKDNYKLAHKPFLQLFIGGTHTFSNSIVVAFHEGQF